jgi:two-component system, chemotaxis family, CheB/CheR fusion protein
VDKPRAAGGRIKRAKKHTPPDADMAFVSVLHLSPTHESRADELLQRLTKIPVVQIVEPTRIEKDHVYIIARANDLTIEAGSQHASIDDRLRGRPDTIDLFVRSLTDAQGVGPSMARSVFSA